MSATTVDRNTPKKDPANYITLDMTAATKIPAGVMVQKSAAGRAVNAAATAANTTLGISEQAVDNSGGLAGDLKIDVRRNLAARFGNSASGDAIAAADIGNDCYVVDNQTVAKTDDSEARPVAGKIVGVDAQGVWVEFR